LNQYIEEKQELFLCVGVYFLYEPTQKLKIPLYEISKCRTEANLHQETFLVFDDQRPLEVSFEPKCTYNSMSDHIIATFKLANAPLAFLIAIPGQHLPKNVIPGVNFLFSDLDSPLNDQFQRYIESLNTLFV
jgi:hypothetical protein